MDAEPGPPPHRRRLPAPAPASGATRWSACSASTSAGCWSPTLATSPSAAPSPPSIRASGASTRPRCRSRGRTSRTTTCSVACRAESAPTRPRRPLVQAIDSTYGDRFSTYFTKSEYRQFTAAVNQDRSGSIGVSIEEVCAGATLCASGQDPTELALEDVLHGQPPSGRGCATATCWSPWGATQVASLGTSLDGQLSNLSNRMTVRRDGGHAHRRPRGHAARLHRHPREPPGPHRLQPDVRYRPRPPGDQLRRGHRPGRGGLAEERARRRGGPPVVLDLRATAAATSPRR